MSYFTFSVKNSPIRLLIPQNGTKQRDGNVYPDAALEAVIACLTQANRVRRTDFIVKVINPPNRQVKVPGGSWHVTRVAHDGRTDVTVNITCQRTAFDTKRTYSVAPVDAFGDDKEAQKRFLDSVCTSEQPISADAVKGHVQVPTSTPSLQKTFLQKLREHAPKVTTWVSEEVVLESVRKTLQKHRARVPDPLRWKEAKSFLTQLEELGQIEIHNGNSVRQFRRRETQLPTSLSAEALHELLQTGDFNRIASQLLAAEQQKQRQLAEQEEIEGQQQQLRAEIARLEKQLARRQKELRAAEQAKRRLQNDKNKEVHETSLAELQSLLTSLQVELKNSSD